MRRAQPCAPRPAGPGVAPRRRGEKLRVATARLATPARRAPRHTLDHLGLTEDREAPRAGLTLTPPRSAPRRIARGRTRDRWSSTPRPTRLPATQDRHRADRLRRLVARSPHPRGRSTPCGRPARRRAVPPRVRRQRRSRPPPLSPPPPDGAGPPPPPPPGRAAP